ncbi:MAG: glutamate--tRNA ligase [Mycoplasma sp.]|nr:glutamate--tRNA ligase [Mycoplasma sp.]
MKIRTRYAPSPTGYFHIGGARTALFNYLYAKHMHGDFIVRIEDTDFERNVEGGTESQLENLKWMGIQPDESPLNPKRYGPYVQSQKLDRYQQLVVKLIGEGKAYYCFCTPEQLEADRQLALKNHQTPKYNRRCLNLTEQEIKEKLKNNHNVAVRLKMEDNVNIEWDDLVRGHMCVPTSALTDPVILKSNGYPMYNFAVVVDDYDMKITHILRGEEHLSNTPYQIAIKKALGFDNQDIKYGHLSIITDETGKKLSKRNKELKQFIEDYRNMGVPAEALNNFLALLGWSSKTNKEVLPINELIKEFDFDRISKAPAFFDFKKLLWMSNQYIKVMPLTNYLKFVKKYLNVDLSKICDEKHHDILLEMFQPQLQYGLQINDLINDLFGNVTKKELSDEIKSFMKKASSIKVLTNFKKQLNNIDELNLENSTQIVNNIKTEESIKGKELFLPIRIVCIYKEHGPEINKTMTIIGKQKILENIEGIIG